nr:MAG TPA: hypothetical protein [Caudoviricetes sp.]
MQYFFLKYSRHKNRVQCRMQNLCYVFSCLYIWFSVTSFIERDCRLAHA